MPDFAFTLSGFADEIDPSLDIQLAVLRKLDIHHIEPRNVDGKNIADYTPAQAKELKKRLDDAGIAVSSMGSPYGKISIHDAFAPHLEAFKRSLEVCNVLSCGYMRMFSFFMPENEDPAQYRGQVMEQLGGFVRAAQGSGVTLLHENEKAIYGDIPARCKDIHDTFAGQIFATYDPSNYVQCGADNLQAFEMIYPYIRYMHMKDSVSSGKGRQVDHGFENVSDAHRPVGLGDGQVPYILKTLKARSYNGYLSIEPHLSANDAFGKTGEEKFTTAANALRGILREIGA